MSHFITQKRWLHLEFSAKKSKKNGQKIVNALAQGAILSTKFVRKLLLGLCPTWIIGQNQSVSYLNKTVLCKVFSKISLKTCSINAQFDPELSTVQSINFTNMQGSYQCY